ncbi:MAG: helix-turn-helix transcriptional regulator [Oscillospiraceae bacterium]
MINKPTAIDLVTCEIAKYIKTKGVSMSAISRATNITMGKLQRSISEEKRPLRAGEFIAVCNFLGVDPMKFKTHTS